MKTLFIILCVALIGCATNPVPYCDVVILTPNGPIVMEKGFLDDPENYWTRPEWDKMAQDRFAIHKQLWEDQQQDKQGI